MWIPQKIYIIIYHKFYKEKKVSLRKKRAGTNKQEIKKTKKPKEIADLHAGERTETRTKQ